LYSLDFFIVALIDQVASYIYFHRSFDIAFNATFDWKINQTGAQGKASLRVPHSWIHQNLEIGCFDGSFSLLVWEGRVDLEITGTN
jgi:hypothetical protein